MGTHAVWVLALHQQATFLHDLSQRTLSACAPRAILVLHGGFPHVLALFLHEDAFELFGCDVEPALCAFCYEFRLLQVAFETSREFFGLWVRSGCSPE